MPRNIQITSELGGYSQPGVNRISWENKLLLLSRVPSTCSIRTHQSSTGNRGGLGRSPLCPVGSIRVTVMYRKERKLEPQGDTISRGKMEISIYIITKQD